MPSYKIRFKVTYDGWIDADDEEEAMHEVCIPEDDSVTYVNNSFEVLKIEVVPDDGPSNGE